MLLLGARCLLLLVYVFVYLVKSNDYSPVGQLQWFFPRRVCVFICAQCWLNTLVRVQFCPSFPHFFQEAQISFSHTYTHTYIIFRQKTFFFSLVSAFLSLLHLFHFLPFPPSFALLFRFHSSLLLLLPPPSPPFLFPHSILPSSRIPHHPPPRSPLNPHRPITAMARYNQGQPSGSSPRKSASPSYNNTTVELRPRFGSSSEQ